ncbi:MAG: SEL1-like repeat protein [Victivallales bacterium]|nr:SEL1-like repeat protein [Victivallales bacterium]
MQAIKRNKYRSIIFALLCCVLSFALADENVRIAVLDFENNTGDANLDHFSKGLRYMIQNDLFVQLPEITFIERAKINQVLNELNFMQSTYVDPSTAAEIGKQIGANYLLTGSYFRHGDFWRIDVNVIKVETAEICYAAKKEDNGEDLSAMINALVSVIARNMPASISQKGQQAFKQEYTYQPVKMQSSSMPGQKLSSLDKYSRAWSRRENGDEEAWRQFLVEIEAEDPAYLGFLYYHGHGVEQDCEKALELFEKGVQRGEASAKCLMGIFHENDKCGHRDLAQAMKWYRQAAEQGHKFAQYNLGSYYEYGYGVQMDMVQAVKWYKMSSDQGYAEAQYRLARCYENGTGV